MKICLHEWHVFGGRERCWRRTTLIAVSGILWILATLLLSLSLIVSFPNEFVLTPVIVLFLPSVLLPSIVLSERVTIRNQVCKKCGKCRLDANRISAERKIREDEAQAQAKFKNMKFRAENEILNNLT